MNITIHPVSIGQYSSLWNGVTDDGLQVQLRVRDIRPLNPAQASPLRSASTASVSSSAFASLCEQSDAALSAPLRPLRSSVQTPNPSA